MLHKTIFVSIPTDTHYRGGLYEFHRNDPEDDMLYCCNGDEAKVRGLINSILDLTDDPKLLQLIYEYGEARVSVARGDWMEDQAGASL